MDYNPHRVKLDQLTSELERARKEAEQLRQDCQRYDKFDVAHVQSQSEAVVAVLPERTERLAALNERLLEANATVTDLQSRASIGINPMFWFSDERKHLVKQRDGAIKARSSLIEAVQRAQAAVAKAQAFATRVAEAQKWYAAFDRAVANARLQALTLGIQEREIARAPLEAQCLLLDKELQPYLDDLRSAQQRSTVAQRTLARAEELEARLDSASNGSERWEIHVLSKETLGNDRPAQVISRSRGDLDAAERNIKKLKQRLEQIATRQSRRIDTLVFDGMNLCFKDKRFIGLAPLQAVIRSLNQKVKTIIVFDGSIRNEGFNERKLRDALGSDVIVHIVNGAADEVVLDLALGEHDYVVSNDHFVDYKTKPAVKTRRLFKHERIDNKIMIHDLGVSTSFM